MDILKLLAAGSCCLAAGMTASCCYHLPAYRSECEEHRKDVTRERLRRIALEQLLAEQDAVRHRYALENDELRRLLVRQWDTLGALPAGPTDVRAADLIPPQRLPLPEGRP